MDIQLEKIIENEAMNTDRIHLYYYPESDHWKAYGQSAANLVRLVPELAATLFEELFSVASISLNCITVDMEQTERYRLPDYCTLMDDNYIELSLDKQNAE